MTAHVAVVADDKGGWEAHPPVRDKSAAAAAHSWVGRFDTVPAAVRWARSNHPGLPVHVTDAGGDVTVIEPLWDPTR